MYEYKATVINIVDGDTIDLIVDCGFGIKKEDRFRLARIDAYEKTLRYGQTEEEKALGIEATKYLNDLILNKEVIVRTEKEGKYGRYIAEIIFEDENLNDAMVKLGYAIYKEY